MKSPASGRGPVTLACPLSDAEFSAASARIRDRKQRSGFWRASFLRRSRRDGRTANASRTLCVQDGHSNSVLTRTRRTLSTANYCRGFFQGFSSLLVGAGTGGIWAMRLRVEWGMDPVVDIAPADEH